MRERCLFLVVGAVSVDFGVAGAVESRGVRVRVVGTDLVGVPADSL